MELLIGILIGLLIAYVFTLFCKEKAPYLRLRDGSRKMVLIVRSDLKMGKGKVAAQCCHACQ